MSWTAVSASGNGRRNDDLVRVLEGAGVTDVLVLDGATSLAEHDYIDPLSGDPAWFVRQFADAFAQVVNDMDDDQEAIVQRALAAVRAAWILRGGGSAVPLYAWPIAALSWIRIRPGAGGHRLQLYCLGDCKVLLGQSGGPVRDLDPYDNAHEHQLQDAVAALVDEGMDDPVRRFAALTPALRQRREQQNRLASPEVLCLAPRGRFAARRLDLQVDGAALLLAMSDGFYRLVDPYGLYDDAALLRACAGRGPQALLDELRGFEAERDTARLSVKGADDASALLLQLDALGAPMTENAMRALVERYLAAYNASDIEGMLATLADGVRFENHAGGQLTAETDGIAAFRRLAERSKSLFAEREQRITRLERRDRMLVVDIAYRGLLAADMPGGPAAGTVIELNGRSEFSFADGRIVRIIDRS